MGIRATQAAVAEFNAQIADACQSQIERIIEDARADVRGTHESDDAVYEYHKRRLQALWLEPTQYEQACRNLATALNI